VANILCTTNILLIDFVATLTPYRPSTWLYLVAAVWISGCPMPDSEEGIFYGVLDVEAPGENQWQTNISALLAAYGHVPLSDLT